MNTAVETAPTTEPVANTGLKPGANEGRFDSKQIESFITSGFQLAVGRDPTKRERQLALDFMNRQQESFASLRTRMTFRPDAPTSLSEGYMGKLKAGDFLIGPQSGWSYQRGRWSGGYEGIRSVERDRGPFALANAASFSNGMVEARVTLHTACETAGIAFRASAKDHELLGYEVVFEPREQRVVLRRHAGELTELARVPADVPTGRGVLLKIYGTDARLRVWIGDDSKPAIDVNDPKPLLGAGQVGVRSWGAALSVDDLMLKPDGVAAVAVRDEQLPPPKRRALEALCLLLLNLNEVVYVD